MLLKKQDQTHFETTYDVVVIGSGLGGMTSANVLAKHGLKVLLLEAHNKLGGLATWFYRKQKQHVFDISLHGFPYGMKKTMRKYWNKNLADHVIQLKNVQFINPQYQIQSTFTKQDFSLILVEKFEVPEQTVQDFFNFLEQMNFYDDNQMTNRDLFQKFFPDRNDIWRFLMEPIVYANGSTLNDPAISYGIVFSNFMSKGVYTFLGGTDYIISLMKEELLHNNVDIKMHAKVEKILCDEKTGEAGGVLVNGKKIKSRSVVSNAHLLSTCNFLLKNSLPSSFLAKLNGEVKNNSSSCQVYIGLKSGTQLKNIGDLIFTSEAGQFDTDEITQLHTSSRTFSMYYPENRPYDEQKRYAIVSSTNGHYEDWDKMSDEEYQENKNILIQDTLASLKKLYPKIEAQIDHIEVATPKTVERFTHHFQGSSFGTKFEGLKYSQELPQHLPGVFHCGSVGIIMSGWLGAANYGVIVANEVQKYLNLKTQNLDPIKNSNKEDSHELPL